MTDLTITAEKIETRESRTAGEAFTERHETLWRGTLTAAQIHAILQTHLVATLATRRQGNRCAFIVTNAGDVFRDVQFELVHDHDWFLKADKDDRQTTDRDLANGGEIA